MKEDTKTTKPSCSPERVRIEQRIEELERQGRFDVDANIDPPTRPLKKGEVDFAYSKPWTRFQTKIANFFAYHFFEKRIKKGDLVIEDVTGIENYLSVKGGALLTCNHFNAYDNYAVYWAIKKHMKGHNLFKIIREGNFTSFPGIYGYFFRHCNTLPIPSDMHVMRDFLNGVQSLLTRGEKILIYPEQAMWLNYRKPRPFKSGAFNFAIKANVPVIPFFISMRDSEKLDADNCPIQIYTVHILKPIYPDEKLPFKEAVNKLKDEDYEATKQAYESVYKQKLVYNNIQGAAE